MSDNRRCPACHLRVAPTREGNIEWHADTAGKQCHASGEPFRIALKARHTGGPRKGQPLRTGSVVAAVVANNRRHVVGARRQVTEARLGLRTLAANPRRVQWHELYQETLTARVLNPRLTLAELATQLGVSRDTYSGRLRRALAYAQRLQEKAA